MTRHSVGGPHELSVAARALTLSARDKTVYLGDYRECSIHID